jgi:hypothetical protein
VLEKKYNEPFIEYLMEFYINYVWLFD